jgi:hypothetical protein
MSEQDPLFDDDGSIPSEPYGHKRSGWSGSDSSARSERGRATVGQKNALAYVANRGYYGATFAELSKHYGVHHGKTSGPLSTLHKTGRLARLAEERNGCKVYVLPIHVDGRATEPHGGNLNPKIGLKELIDFIDEVDRRLPYGTTATTGMAQLRTALIRKYGHAAPE